MQTLSPQDRAAIDKTPMPVLWPSAEMKLSRTAFVARDAFYSLAATSTVELSAGESSTATLTVQGTRKMMQYENMPKNISNRTYRDTPAFFTVNEGIVSATWFEFGVSYSVDVECSAVGDPRCSGDGYLKELVESLRFVGGQR